jgi:putative endonuclease
MSVVRVRAGEPFYKKRALIGALLFTLMFYLYILQSESSGRYYIGHTNNLDRRLAEHNNPTYISSKTTKRFKGPWMLVYFEKYPNRSDAMAREGQIKAWKNRKAIENLIAKTVC